MATEGTPAMGERENYRMVTVQQGSRTSLRLSIANVMHRVSAPTTKMEKLLTQPTATTICLYVVVDHMVKEGSLICQGEASIIHEAGGSIADSVVEDEGVEDLGVAGGEELRILMLLYRRRSGTIQLIRWFEHV